MITRLEATSYRCFDHLDANMSAFQVLAGANGSGKTTLLDIPVILGQLLTSRNPAAVFMERIGNRAPRAATLRELIHRGKGDTFILAVEARIPEPSISAMVAQAAPAIKSNKARWPSHLRYEIRLAVTNGHQLSVKDEYLFAFPMNEEYEQGRLRLQGENAVQRDWRFIIKRQGSSVDIRPELPLKGRVRSAQADDSLLAFPKVQFESEKAFTAARWLYQLLVEGAVFYSPDLEGLRTASPPGLPMKVIPSAANLPWLALELSKKDPERFGKWIDHVRIALPQVTTISAREREEDHFAYFIVNYAGGHEVTSSGLSDGTLRVLALTILPYLPDQPPILVTEEPENGIHPRAIEAVLQSLSSMYNSQVWISSHSPVVLAHVKLEQVLCTRLETSGQVNATPGPQHPRLVDWKGAIDLGSLFAAGVLG